MPLNIIFTNPGTYTIDDDGIRGNNISAVRDGSGAILFTFLHPSDTLTFVADTPGVNFIFNVLDSFGSADVSVGSLTSAAQSPDLITVRQMRTDGFMTLVSNGAILEIGADAAADIIGAAVVLSAGTGIGTAGNALEIQTTFIEAETNSGGINLANFGQVQIGGITPDVAGLNVANSGDLNFLNYGPIFLADTTGASIVHGGDLSGNVTLTAIGADADIYDTINQIAIRAPGGGITLNAGRDILLGLGGANYNNDVLATGDIRINVGRDFLLDGTSNIRTGAFGGVVGGGVFITAGRDIRLTNTTGGQQTIESFNGDVTLTTGPGGTYLQNTSFSATVQTTGDIFLNADNVLMISGGLNTTGIGRITIRPITPGRGIQLGTTLDPFGAIGLSEAELDRLFTLNVDIGDANTGLVDVSGAITPNTFPTNLFVRSGTEILVRAPITLGASLILRAGDDIFFTGAGSFTTTDGGFTGVVDDLQNDGGAGGFGDLGGTISVTNAITLVGNGDNDTLAGTDAANTILGNGGNDRLDGRGGADVLVGGAGNDTLIGGTGAANELIGGTGDDVYVVSVLGDSLVEAAGEGVDRVETDLASYTLTTNLENLTFIGLGSFSGTGNGAANVITGGTSGDTLFGLDGDDTLIGGSGAANTLIGGSGNDLYFIAAVGDSVIEAAGGGSDQVRTALASYTMAANVETLFYTGAASFNGVGNSGDNVIFGGGMGDMLNGADGADTLIGLGGNDMLMGGTGAPNTMQGGLGNDVYFVSVAGDSIVEFAGEGTDQVNTGLSSHTLGANVEYLIFTGAGSFTGTGNGLANFIAGGGSADTLAGLDDNDALSGNGGSDLLQGGAGQDVLNGGVGNDILDGGADADLLLFDNALGAGNVDTVLGFLAGVDRFLLDDAVFVGLAPGVLPASAFVVGGAAADADDRIIYNSATGQLLFDADGNGAGSAVQFATLGTGLPLSASEFVVI